ncbi:TVP38/TMEM64 family membrane protein [Halomicronema hongdechloris C2206]|uniref:TVP38/TMEM64 family membrane protein n=1 Tax=Halomicronema hongdechloris C2206 TaxID=1641165 RepID=A0A1Z3HLK7_9CYAN|nr:TVP38/TMEM64 family membrane protein [Halomicronema hongdechloris C2206]
MLSRRSLSRLKFIALGLLIVLAIWLINHYGMAQIRAQVDQLGMWSPLAIFCLRFTSVVVPALPGTAYSVLSGGLLGFSQGLAVICLADLLSCCLSFCLSRRYGRQLVQRLVGERLMTRVDTLSQRHLERNFFLMTGFLMTGFFDFVCYGVGLTKAPWLKFAPALVLSIAISNPPIVALGAGILEGGKLLLGFALLGIFGLAIVTGLVQRYRVTDAPEP